MIPQSEWKWFGNAGHFICGHDCRFHLCTLVGKVLVSTVGQLWPDSAVREIHAEVRGVKLQGKGDERANDYMQKFGYEDVGYKRKFETMAFKAGKPCKAKGCNCGTPSIDGSEIEFAGYNTAGEATKGHMRICLKVSRKGGER